jgi:hypothetical protein
MNDFSIGARFLVAVAGVALALGAIYPLKYLTLKMAAAAIEAQQHDQMSYGKFSRQLWGSGKLQHKN